MAASGRTIAGEFKRASAPAFGATHAVATAEEARTLARDLTWGVGADQAIVTVGVVTEDVVSAAFAAIRKGGIVVLTGLAGPAQKTVSISGWSPRRIPAEVTRELQGRLAGQFVWGSDFPFIAPERCLAELDELGIASPALLRDNAARILQLGL